jgi:hypothetical protein
MSLRKFYQKPSYYWLIDMTGMLLLPVSHSHLESSDFPRLLYVFDMSAARRVHSHRSKEQEVTHLVHSTTVVYSLKITIMMQMIPHFEQK